MNEKSIIAEHISKSFKIYSERRDTLFEIIKNINKKNNFQKLQVLNDISFSLYKGKMLGIIGFNGTGKSTLLRIICRILEPDEGKMTVTGKITPLLELGTGMNPELISDDNIVQYGAILGFSRKQMEQKIDNIMDFAELEKFRYTKLKHFSSGMLARLAFSTAMEVNPDILLLDEILSVGDIHFQKKSFDALMSFKKRGKTIVVVSHSLDFIENFCDEAMILNDGVIAEFGSPEKIVSEYKKMAEKISNQ